MIIGVKITPLRQVLDGRGKVMHMLRADTAPFIEFGEIYFSCIYPSAIKAWKLHKKMTLNCAVPYGHIKFVMYDDREKSPSRGKTQELFMGSDSYCLVTVPPMIWTGFQCIGQETAILANCATLPHTPDECERRDIDDAFIQYNWM